MLLKIMLLDWSSTNFALDFFFSGQVYYIICPLENGSECF